MGQINYGKQKPKYCNLAAIQSSGSKVNTVLANGEIWLVDTTNATKANEGAGVYDAYIIGDGSKAASALTVEYLTARIDLSAYSTTAQMNAAIQNAVSGKQDTISDIATIRSGAALGATSIQSHQDISGKANVADVYTKSQIDTALGGKQDEISSVTVAVDANTGTPAGTVSFNNNTLAFNFQNLKGEKGDTGAQGPQGLQGATGPQGPKGDAGITGDVSSLVIKQAIDVEETYVDTDVAGAETVKTLTNEDLSNEEVIARALVEFASYFEDGYRFKGLITPERSIGTQIQKVAYIGFDGVYRNLDSNVYSVPGDCIGLFIYNGTNWELKTTSIVASTYLEITDFSDWEVGYYTADGVLLNTSANGANCNRHKWIRILAGQTVSVNSFGSRIFIAKKDLSNPIYGTDEHSKNIQTYTAEETEDIYISVQVTQLPGGVAITPPVVTFSNIGSQWEHNNIVSFGYGDKWEDVVSALSLKDKRFVTEKDAYFRYGQAISASTELNNIGASYYRFENDGYKYVYADVPYYRQEAYYGLAFYSDLASAESFINGLQFAYATLKIGDRRIFKMEVPEGCKYIYITSNDTADNRTSKVLLFKGSEFVSLDFLLENFKLTDTPVLDHLTDVESAYSRYGEYLAIRNNFGKVTSNTNSTFRCIFASDIHGKEETFKRMVTLTNKWAEDGYVDTMIMTGDIAWDLPTESYEWFHKQRARCNVDILSLPGNHDWNYNVTGDKERTYNNIIAPMVNGITVNEGEEDEYVAGQVESIVQPSDALENHRLYYYKDYGNIRFIGIYKNVDSADQLTWLQEVLADAVTNNKAVIIGNHCGFAYNIAKIKYSSSTDYYQNCPNTFFTPDGSVINSGVDPYGYDTPIDATYVAAVKTFMDNGGTFICWLTGHAHSDHFYDVIDHNIYGYQLMLNTNAASNHFASYDIVRVGYPADTDCYNYLTVDTNLHMIRLLRIGSNTDILGRSRLTFVYDYVNHVLVENR